MILFSGPNVIKSKRLHGSSTVTMLIRRLKRITTVQPTGNLNEHVQLFGEVDSRRAQSV